MPSMYCLGKKIVKVLMQDSALLHGVIAYAISGFKLFKVRVSFDNVI